MKDNNLSIEEKFEKRSNKLINKLTSKVNTHFYKCQNFKSEKKISFELPCDLELYPEYDNEDSFAFSCEKIDSILKTIANIFNIRNNKRRKFNFTNIYNYNNIHNKPAKFIIVSNKNISVILTVKTYFKKRLQNQFMYFYINIIDTSD